MHADAMSSRAVLSLIAFNASIVQAWSDGEGGEGTVDAAGAPTYTGVPLPKAAAAARPALMQSGEFAIVAGCILHSFSLVARSAGWSSQNCAVRWFAALAAQHATVSVAARTGFVSDFNAVI